MTEVDIIIISFAKTKELKIITERGLQSLLESDDVKFNVFVVESNKEVNYDEYVNTKTIYTDEPFGYNKYLNIGVAQGSAPFVCLCNSDLTYEKGWATEIILQMGLNPEIMSASPFCPQTQNINDWNKSEVYEGTTIRRELAGWAIFIRRKLFNDIENLFDERFVFWYADNDYGMTLKKHGIIHVLVPTSVVNHHDKNLGKTGDFVLTQEEKNNYTAGQYKVFQDKWK